MMNLNHGQWSSTYRKIICIAGLYGWRNKQPDGYKYRTWKTILLLC